MPQPRSAATPRRGREGSKWYNERPTAREFSTWFHSVPIHEGLKHEDYIGGIVLIPSTEKAKEVQGFNESTGAPIIVDVTNLVYSPHPNVTARVRYFNDYLALHPEWLGFLQVDTSRTELGLPAGFFRYAAAGADGKATNFIGYSAQARILQRDGAKYVDVREGSVRDGLIQTRRIEGLPITEGAPGSKIAPVTGRWGVDENALMKAQSGAVGRALGNAGMLVIPGSAIATAEDMQEALSGENAGVAAELPRPSPVNGGPGVRVDDPKVLVAALKADLGKLDSDAVGAFEEWAAGRGLKMTVPGDVTTAIKRLERDIDRLTRAEPT